MSNLRSEFHNELAHMFMSDLQFRRANYYYYLGKVTPWSATDQVPPLPSDTYDENSKIRSNMIYAKKISPSDVTLACRNIPWEAGKIFAKWDHTKDMSSLEFFAITDEFKVYKCLDNNGNRPSSSKPVGNSIYPLRTEDGYLWKYMYTVPTFKRSKFISVPNIPVQKALSDSFYNKGSIDNAVIKNRGSGYTDAQLTLIQIAGTTTGTGGSFSITVGNLGQITSVDVLDGGSGYTKGARLSVNTLTGSGAELEPVIAAGTITSVNVISGGLGYDLSDNVVASVGGAVLVPKMSRSTGSVVDVEIVDPGIGYVSPPLLTLVGAGGAGTGMYEGNTAAILDAIEDLGSIVRVTISDPGKDYPVDTDTTIVIQGDGVGAAMSPVVYNGELIDVVIEYPGFGYTSVNITVVGSGVGAEIEGVITQSDYISDQSIVEQTAVPGAVYAIEVVDQGGFYSDQTTVEVSGDGSGCVAVPIIENQKIVAIKVLEYGSNYTYASVSFIDPLAGSGASAYCIFPPRNGHGFDAISELNGNTVAINTTLRNEIISKEIAQDFRQYGIIKDPRDYFTGRLFYGNDSLLTFKVLFSGVDGLEKDEVLKLGEYRYIVADIIGSQVYLQALHDKPISPIGLFTAEADQNRIYTSVSILYSPNLNKYSGSLLYLANELPFAFSEEQGITVKTFIKF